MNKVQGTGLKTKTNHTIIIFMRKKLLILRYITILILRYITSSLISYKLRFCVDSISLNKVKITKRANLLGVDQ